MSSTTFFGEVNELSSRAVYWSEEESDEESGESQPIETNVSVNVNGNLPEECQTVFVSLSKSEKSQDLTQICSITIGESSVNVGHIIGLNKTSIWLRLNANNANLKNYLLVKTISSLMKQISSKLLSKPLVVLISKDLMKDIGSDEHNHLPDIKQRKSINNRIGSQVKTIVGTQNAKRFGRVFSLRVLHCIRHPMHCIIITRIAIKSIQCSVCSETSIGLY